MRSSISHLGRAFLLSIAMFAGTHHAAAEPITYQGRLTDATLPATGSYDMIFRVFDAATGGSLLATAPTLTVSTLDGLIIATPDFPAGTFTGATVYMDIWVRQTGGIAFIRLSPRQAITPAPLAMRSLNERWSPLSTSRIRTDAGVTNVIINDTDPTYGDAALMVSAPGGPGVVGGMYVNTLDAGGFPYYGWSANRVSLAEARVDGATNTFILRSATTEWIRITTEGRVGIGTTATASERLRVNGNIYSTADITAASDVVANGTVTATGNITSSGEVTADAYDYTTAQTRSFSIAPEGLQPSATSQDGWFGGTNGQAYFSDSVGAGAMTAGVYLPDGATVTGLYAYVIDDSAASNVSISMARRGLAVSGYSPMASVESTGASASVVTLTDTTIANAIIDNDAYCYNIWIYCDDWPGVDMLIKGVRIRYTVPGPD